MHDREWFLPETGFCSIAESSGKTFSFNFYIEVPSKNNRQEKSYRNPVILALEMKEIIERENISRAELARRMELSRVRITQIMNLLKLSPEVIEMIKELGDRLKRPVVTERWLGDDYSLLLISSNFFLLSGALLNVSSSF